ncbi:hypothetical protein OG884_05725 [Streptosporangium sp. NBC_01755]|uniref:hypothetical protein n=1 Tax=unclassified Streptosporangium TaxID=2632669 RepID=UPI002DD7C5D7|nr:MULTISPECIES: hypothetical protein [unclassified Streptosporangium]WSA23670.1 hypothetical protein OIE13_22275 [Streptosporangium sp. NBC_01810]WSD01424.1 hypothetical protein OG884_05725 [Streptosporangium sp. NBC_01755]
MAKAGYSVVTGAAVSLVASTAKSVLGIKSGEAFGLDLKKVWWGFTGVDATDASVVCELCYCTWATNAPGTNSTSVTPAQVYGRTIAHGVTAARNWTTEPTVLTVIGEIPLSPNGGTLLYDIPLGDTPDCAPDHGFVLRFTAVDTVSVRATMFFERA